MYFRIEFSFVYLQSGDGDGEGEPARTGTTGIDIEYSVFLLDEWFV